jgi:uncharacterized protein YebE (UPF0316 family)
MVELLAGPAGPVLIFFLRITDVSLGTMRLVLVTRGARTAAALLGFVEVLIWILAAGTAVRHLADPLFVVGYAGGFGAGTWVGMWLEEKFPLGTAMVQAFCRDPGSGVAEALRALGVGVTEMDADGLTGPVEVVSTIVHRQTVPRVIDTIEARDPDAFITVYDARVRRGWFPTLQRK